MGGFDTEVAAPPEDTMMGLKHRVCYLLRVELEMNVLRPDGQERSVAVGSG